jgi:hypothetical protein
MKLEISVSGFDFDLSAVKNAVENEIKETAELVERTAKELVPVDTGALKRSINAQGSGMTYDISATTDYAAYMEYGTRPHVITGSPLLWWDGAGRPYEKVNHPGNRAYLYMSTAFDSHTEGLDRRIADAIGDIL